MVPMFSNYNVEANYFINPIVSQKFYLLSKYLFFVSDQAKHHKECKDELVKNPWWTIKELEM